MDPILIVLLQLIFAKLGGPGPCDPRFDHL